MSSNKPPIPPVPATITDPAVRQYLESLAESVSIASGHRGDPLDRSLTVRDLLGQSIVVGSGSGSGGYREVPFPSGNSNQPDHLIDLSIPLAPINLEANVTPTTVILTWTASQQLFVSHTEIHRSETENFGDAVPLGVASGSIYSDAAVNPLQTYYYWVRFVSYAFVYSPFHSLEPVEATLPTNAENLLEQLEEKLTQGEFSAPVNNLLTRVPLVESDLIEETTNRQNADSGLSDSLDQEITNRQQAIQTEIVARNTAIGIETTNRAAAIDSVINSLAAETNARNAAIDIERSARVAADSSLGADIVAEATRVDNVISSLSDETAQRVAAIQTEESARVTADNNLSTGLNAEAQRIDTLFADLSTETVNRKAAVQSEESARISADNGLSSEISAEAERIDTLVTDLSTETVNRKAAVQSEESARISADNGLSSEISAEAERIDTLVTDLSTETVNRKAAVQSEESARVSADNDLSSEISAEAERIDTLVTDLSSETVNRKAAVQSEESARISADNGLSSEISAEAERIDTLVTDLSTETVNRKAAVQSEESARVSADNDLSSEISAEAERIDTLVTDLSTETVNRTAAVQSEESARVSADNDLSSEISAEAERIDTLVTDLSTETVNRTAAVQSEESARVSADNDLSSEISAEAERIDTLVTDLSTETVNRTAAVQSEESARISADNGLSSEISAEAQRIDTLRTDLSSETTNRQAAIQTAESARVQGDADLAESVSAEAERIDTLIADLSDETIARTAAIQAEQTARVTADSALASDISTMQTTIGDQTSSIQVLQETTAELSGNDQSEAIAVLQAQYSVKLDVNGHVSGYAAVNDGTTSAFVFRADTFAVGAPGVDSLSFVIDGTKVVMDGASIKDATIGDAKISSLTIDKLIGNTAAFVEANINEGSITNAMIGQEIKSDGYVAGSTGWRIHKSGYAEFSDIKVRGLIEGSIIRGSVIEGGMLIQSDIQITTPTEADQGADTIRYLSLTPSKETISSYTHGYGSLATRSSALFGLVTANYTAEGYTNYGDGSRQEPVYNRFDRYPVYRINPTFELTVHGRSNRNQNDIRISRRVRVNLDDDAGLRLYVVIEALTPTGEYVPLHSEWKRATLVYPPSAGTFDGTFEHGTFEGLVTVDGGYYYLAQAKLKMVIPLVYSGEYRGLRITAYGDHASSWSHEHGWYRRNGVYISDMTIKDSVANYV